MFGASERRQSRRRRRFGRACATLFERILTICRNFLRRASLWALRLASFGVFWGAEAATFNGLLGDVGRLVCEGTFALFGGFCVGGSRDVWRFCVVDSRAAVAASVALGRRYLSGFQRLAGIFFAASLGLTVLGLRWSRCLAVWRFGVVGSRDICRVGASAGATQRGRARRL